MKYKICSCIFLLIVIIHNLLYPQNLSAQQTETLPFSITQIKAYTAYEKLDFQEARKLLETEKEIQTPATCLLLSFADLLELSLHDNLNNYAKFAAQEDKYIEQLNKLRQIYPLQANTLKTTQKLFADYAEAEIKLQWTFIHLKYGHEWRALKSMRAAFKLLKQIEKQAPNFTAMQKSLGLLYVILAVIPENKQWILSFVGLEANQQKGLVYLQKAANSHDFITAKQSQWLLVLVETFIAKNQEKALHYITTYQLHTQTLANQENVLQKILLTWVYLKNGQAKKAITIHQSNAIHKYNLQNYLYAESLLLSNQRQEAKKYYEIYLQNLTSNLYCKDAYYKLFIISYLAENTEKATYYVRQILDKGNTNTSVDRYAQKFAEKNIMPHKKLLLVRLLTDGGELYVAEKELNSMEVEKITDNSTQQEYYYRKARLLHKQDNRGEAVICYKKTISCTNTDSYFAPNSALQIAKICVAEGKRQDALFYLNLLFEYHNYEYETGIRNEGLQIKKELGK
jgi:hypothetical protein